jgi:hypothetical protein
MLRTITHIVAGALALAALAGAGLAAHAKADGQALNFTKTGTSDFSWGSQAQDFHFVM